MSIIERLSALKTKNLMKNIIEALNWRYAAQVFDKNKKLTDGQLDLLLDAARLSPSSFGLQAWKFILVNNPETRAKLREAGYNQAKITDASHLIVIAVPKVINSDSVKEYMESISKTRGVDMESLQGFSDMLNGAINMRTPEQRVEWATRQAYIALGVLLTTAAVEGIDAGPMEGFDPKKFDEILGLEALGLESKAAVALGFRSEDDVMAKAAKVRFSKDRVVVEVN
ncbi:MAG: NAD(P)H-dependent oxidoreductase [Candidatus Paceibacterota bacterium]|jgi:nitroreductase